MRLAHASTVCFGIIGFLVCYNIASLFHYILKNIRAIQATLKDAKISIPVLKNVFQYLVEGGTLALQVEKCKRKRDNWISVIVDCGFNLVDSRITGQEKNKYSAMAKKDQHLIIAQKGVAS